MASSQSNRRGPKEEEDDSSRLSLQPPELQSLQQQPPTASSSNLGACKTAGKGEVGLFPDTTSPPNISPTSKSSPPKVSLKGSLTKNTIEVFPDTKYQSSSRTSFRQKKGKEQIVINNRDVENSNIDETCETVAVDDHRQYPGAVAVDHSKGRDDDTSTIYYDNEHISSSADINIHTGTANDSPDQLQDIHTTENEQEETMEITAELVSDRSIQSAEIVSSNVNLAEMQERLHALESGKEQNEQLQSRNSKPRNVILVVSVLTCVLITIAIIIGVSMSRKNGEQNEPVSITSVPTTISILPTPRPTVSPLTKTTWIKNGDPINGLNLGDLSGWSVSMSLLGDIIVIGAPAVNAGKPGTAQIYTFNSSTSNWELIGTLDDGTEANEAKRFGNAVSVSNDGDMMVIGAYYESNRAGAAYIYYFNKKTNDIQVIRELVADNANDFFGYSVDASGDGSTVIVSANQHDGQKESQGIGSGYVKVYREEDGSKDNGSTWDQVGNTIKGTSLNDTFGAGVSISNDGNIIAVGAPQWYVDGVSGYVNIYQYDAFSNTWIDYGNSNDNVLVGDNPNDYFGASISLSSNGNIVAVGAPFNDGINGDKRNCGTVKIFKLNSDTKNWEQLGENIDGENENDYSGFHQGVELSENGMILAIGSYQNDGVNRLVTDSGSVRIFEYDSFTDDWIQISQDIDGEAPGDRCGISLSISGDGSTMAFGCDFNDDNGFNSGHVRIYHRGG